MVRNRELRVFPLPNFLNMTQTKTSSDGEIREKLYLVAGGSVLGAVALLLSGVALLSKVPANLPRERSLGPTQTCAEIVQPKAALSREQLAKLLSVPERTQRRKVQEIAKEPYCRLPSLSLRAGATTARDIYPLAFDPQTSLVIIYEGETYVGYGFKRS